MEDQFDSCWNCARQPIRAPAAVALRKLKWLDYAFAGLVSYAVPFAAFLLSANRLDEVALGRASIWLWMSVPAVLSFLILRPFLRQPVWRRVVLAFLCLAWTCLFRFGVAMTK
jgi:hypothetical protein